MTSCVNAARTAVDALDVREHETELARRYPDAVGIWFGTFTRTWWALLKAADGSWTHVEAPGPFSLAEQLDVLLPPSRPIPAKTEDPVRPVVVAPDDDRPRGRHGGRHERKPK